MILNNIILVGLSGATPIYLHDYIETDSGSSKTSAQLDKALFHSIATLSGKKKLQNVNEEVLNGS